MINSILVLSDNADDQPRAIIFSAISKKYDSSRQTLQSPFTTSKTAVKGYKGYDATVKILETSWRKSTHFKDNYKKHWLCYSKTMAKIGVTMFDKGHVCSMCYNSYAYTPYNSLNNHPVINKYMTGVFNLRLPNPKLSFV